MNLRSLLALLALSAPGASLAEAHADAPAHVDAAMPSDAGDVAHAPDAGAAASPGDAASAPGKKSEGQVVDRVAAVVNSEIILLSEVREHAAQLGVPGDDDKALRPVLDRMIDDALVLQQADELKLTVEQAEIDKAIDEVRKNNHLDEQQFRQALTEQGFTEEAFRRDMRKQILRLKVINTAVRSRTNVSDEDVRAYYERMVRQSGGHREAHVRHLLVAVPEQASPQVVEERRRQAAALLAKVREGADFAELARRASDDRATRDEGGDLGWLREGDGLPQALSDVIFSMDKAGETRGPVRTERGFEVVQLVERREGDVRSFDEAKEQLRQQLYSEQLEKQTQLWIEELHKRAHIDVRL